ncbi:MAG: hypothetical protein Q8908_07985, partial [Bacteroidota bacterium]|nr:hypothetical protein [Bacteroidota bacterium]
MNHIVKIAGIAILIAGILLIGSNALAQNVPAASSPVCVYCGAALPNGVHAPNCPYNTASLTKTKVSIAPALDIKTMVVGSIFQSLLSSMLNSSPVDDKKSQEAAQMEANLAAMHAAKMKRYNDSVAQVEYEKMMATYKQLEGSQEVTTKTLSNTNLDFKTLNGDAEALSANARHQFERGIKIPVADSSSQHQATGFFGDTMPMTDIQTLVEPENNPDVVDLRQSKQYVAAQIKSDSLNIVTLLRKDEAKENGEPIIQKPDCVKLKGLLNAYTRQRSEFQKTILLSNSQLDIWEAKNRNALVNAAKDGIDYFIGEILDALKNRGEIADKYQMVLDNNVNQMMGEGIDVTKIQNEIAQLRKISARGQTADFLNSLKDWNTFMKDGLSSLIGELSESNKDVSGILEDPMMKKYFEPESSKLNTLLDIS